MKQLCNKIFRLASCYRQMLAIFLLLLYPCCQTPQLSLPKLFLGLRQELLLPLAKNNAATRLDSLENLLDQAIAAGQSAQFSRAQRLALLTAITRYQLYYVISPNRHRYYKLRSFYSYFDVWHRNSDAGNDDFREFKKLREIMTGIIKRNDKAQLRLQQLMAHLEKQPQLRHDFFSKLIADDEVGGVVFYCRDRGIEIRFIHDERRERYRQYWRQFRANDFSNLERLERISIHRFLLQKVGADASTRLYNRVVLKIIVRCFATIKTLAAKDKLTPEQARQLRLAKKKILAFGLEKRSIRRSYFLDPTPYLSRADTAFFFHSHPLRPGPKYQKKTFGAR